MRHLIMMISGVCLLGAMAPAVVVGPYPIDSSTLHLWHFDTAINGVAPDMVTNNPIHLPLVNGAALTASAGGFGNALNTYDGIANPNGGIMGPYAGDAVNTIAISRLTGSDGAFTFEAIVRPDMAPGAEPTHMEIICGEGDGANETRGFQFRIQDGGTTLRFQSLAGTPIAAFDAPIAFTAGKWYHAAVTYNGNANTAGNLKLYWTELGTATTAQQVGSDSLNMTIDLTATVTTRFAIGNELRTTNGIGNENFEGLIDEVRISGIARAADDMILRSSIPWAKNPVPASGQTTVNPSITKQLGWDTAELANVTKHYVYLAESEPNFTGISPAVVTDLIDPIESAVTLTTDKVYYWRVDESINHSSPSDPNTVTGPIWSFETIKSGPAITADPDDAAVFPANAASFEAGFNSITTPTASWYKAGEPDVLLAGQTGAGTTVSGDYTVIVTDLGDGLFTSTLTVADTEIADEGYYYCSVTNSSSETQTTLSAGLAVKRLVAHYPFDGDANDAIGTVHGTLKNIDPNNSESLPVFVGGAPNYGQAIKFDGTQFVELTTAAYPKSGIGGALEAGTVVCWVRLDGFTATAMAMGNHNDGSGPGCQMWFSGTNGQQINFRLRQNTGDTEMPQVSGLTETTLAGDGQWHLLAATYEKGSVGQLYLDGEPFGASDAYTANPAFNPWTYPTIIGGNNNRGTITDLLNGAIDDLRVYNYRLGGLEIADLYLAGYPDAKPCILEYASQFDFTGPEGKPDCIVNLNDFAVMAAEWLSCGFYPQCQ